MAFDAVNVAVVDAATAVTVAASAVLAVAAVEVDKVVAATDTASDDAAIWAAALAAA